MVHKGGIYFESGMNRYCVKEITEYFVQKRQLSYLLFKGDASKERLVRLN